jgi:hypothetical protein
VALANESMNDVQNFCILHGAKEDSDGSHMELQEIIVVKPHRADRWENQRESWIKRHVSSVIVDSSYRQIYVDHELKLQQYRK